MRPHATLVPPEPLPRTPDALLLSTVARVSKIMPWDGMGVALGPQVGHVDAYRDSPEGYLIYTVFTKECQKRSKRGYPPPGTTFREDFTLLGTPPGQIGPSVVVLGPGGC